jgi:hypothetical protein
VIGCMARARCNEGGAAAVPLLMRVGMKASQFIAMFTNEDPPSQNPRLDQSST